MAVDAQPREHRPRRPAAAKKALPATKTAQGRGTTRAEKALELALIAVADNPPPDVQAFWRAWTRDGGTVVRALADFRAACPNADAAGDLMSRVVAVLSGAEGAKLAAALTDKGLNLAKGLMSAAIDHFLTLELSGQCATDEAGLSLTVGFKLTAELLGAIAHDCGLMLEKSPTSGEFHLDNVRWDHPSHEFGSPDAAFEAWLAELLAWCDAKRNGQTLMAQVLDPKRVTQDGAPDPRDVRRELARVERETGVRPLLAAVAKDLGNLAKDQGLRKRLSAELGVQTAVVSLGEQDKLAKAIVHAEASVRRHMQRLYAALHGKPADSTAAKVRSKVFISYAHKDGSEWMEGLSGMLDALYQAQLVELWSDERITTGQAWKAEIGRAMDSAACAVLVLTPGFLRSKFIKEVELPALIRRHEADGLKLFPLVAVACPWKQYPDLNWLQVACVGETLEELKPLGRHSRRMSDLAEEIQALLGV